MTGAKYRCNNPNSVSWDRYGAKGIKFLFASVEEAAKWIVVNIGARPSNNYTIDRIDGGRHYEPGNLRWATIAEQNRNKGDYNGFVYGNRMKRLCKLRPDYSYEGIRRYVIKGFTDEQILEMKKPPGGRPKKNA